MQIYLVGGAVRDALLGLPVKERDWVVVGATPEALLTQGYRQVGKDFPVFLHPQSQEEYALARTERKTGAGYRGFEVHTSPDVSLEQDLQRRDLTINAIAQDKHGHLIDPYGGQADIKRGLLRHISPAFSEDPVRILRVARFAARFTPLHFHVADETLSLMRTMCESGEVNALTAERVWAEFHKALHENSAHVFFEVLQSCSALNKIFPEVRRVESCNAALIQACKLSDEPQIRFAAWAYPLGEQGIQNLCKRLSTPHAYLDLALLVARQHAAFTHATELPPPRILEMLKELDGFRRPERFEAFLLAAEAVSRAISGHEHWPHPQREYLHTTLVAARKINAKNLTKIGLEGDQIAVELDIHRRAAISKVKRTYRWAKFN